MSQQTLLSLDDTKVTTEEEYTSMDSLLAFVRDSGLLSYRQKIIDAGGTMNAAVYPIRSLSYETKNRSSST